MESLGGSFETAREEGRFAASFSLPVEKNK
jgi:hypothetical protein